MDWAGLKWPFLSLHLCLINRYWGAGQRFLGDWAISRDGPLYVTDQANAHRIDQGLYVPRKAGFFLMSDEIVDQTESRPQQPLSPLICSYFTSGKY